MMEYTPLQAHWDGKRSKYQVTFVWLAERWKQHMPLSAAAALIRFHTSDAGITVSLLRAHAQAAFL